ncbi:MAG: efflux RND transporter periplasmic adaptor subunit [Treponema sp.]|nr:efflux RND transporter periplasmic adaptor subunit [Treponema sp.]
MKNKKAIVTVVLVILCIVAVLLIAYKLAQNFAPLQEALSSLEQPFLQRMLTSLGLSGDAHGGEPDGGQSGGRSGDRAGTAIRVVPVILGTVEHSVILNGDVRSSSEVSIYPTMAGKLTELRVRDGDRVSRGQVIAMVDPSRPGDSFFLNPVVSTVSGVVVSVPVSAGDTLQTNSVICVVGNLGDLRVETYVPERYSVSVRRFLPAQVSFEAMPGETFAAEIDELSPVLDPASRTLRIRLRILPNSSGRVDPRILPGMFATVSLVTESRKDVPVIPRPVLIHTYGSWIVFVVPENSAAARRREVTLGLEDETMVEILAGLEYGERVVIEGQNFLTDGDPVRIVE